MARRYAYALEQAEGQKLRAAVDSAQLTVGNPLADLKGERVEHYETQHLCKAGRVIRVSVVGHTTSETPFDHALGALPGCPVKHPDAQLIHSSAQDHETIANAPGRSRRADESRKIMPERVVRATLSKGWNKSH